MSKKTENHRNLDRLLGRSLSRRSAVKAGALGTAALSGLAFKGAPGATAQGSGRLVVGKPGELLDFDPHFSANQISWEIHAVVYESLVFLDDTLGPVPGLAASWETPDDRTYIFTLRDNAMFHNGRAMTADDVVFSLRRVLESPESWWDIKMGPVLEPDPAEVAAVATAVAQGTPDAFVGDRIGVTLEATGPNQVTATLTEPYAPFLQALTGTTCSIVPAAEIERGELGLATEMVGTGPFQVVEHLPDQRWVFSRFAEYWGEGAGQISELVWQIIPDESARLASLRTGEVQLTMFENPALLDLLANEQNITTVEQVTTNYYILFANANMPELADQRVRQAISLAMDREQLSQTALFGHGAVTGPVASAFTELAAPLAELPFYTRDVERARQLLSEAGVSGELPLTIHVSPALAATVPMAEVLQEQLAEVGIQLEIVQRDLATFIDEYAGDEPTSQLAISWWAGYSDPYMILVNFIGGLPFIGLEDPDLEDLVRQAGRETDPAARLGVLRDLEAAVATLGNWQPMVTRNNFVAYRNDLLTGVAIAPNDGFGLPLWHNIKDMNVTQ